MKEELTQSALHIHQQKDFLKPSYIVGTRQGLEELKNLIDQALSEETAEGSFQQGVSHYNEYKGMNGKVRIIVDEVPSSWEHRVVPAYGRSRNSERYYPEELEQMGEESQFGFSTYDLVKVNDKYGMVIGFTTARVKVIWAGQQKHSLVDYSRIETVQNIKHLTGLVNEDGRPILFTLSVHKSTTYYAWCTSCNHWHNHSVGDGHRAAHCSKPPYRFKQGGYVLRGYKPTGNLLSLDEKPFYCYGCKNDYEEHDIDFNAGLNRGFLCKSCSKKKKLGVPFNKALLR